MSVTHEVRQACGTPAPFDAQDVQATTCVAGTTAFFVAQVVALMAGLGMQAIAARGMTAGDYGRFAVTNSMLLATGYVLCGMLPRAFARQVSVAPACLPIAWRSVFTLQLPVVAAIGLLLWACRSQLGELLQDREMIPLVSLGVVLLTIHCGILEPTWHLFNGLGRHRLQATLLGMHGILRCGAVYAILLYEAGAAWAVRGLLLAAVGSALVATPILAVLARQTPISGVPRKLDYGDIWNWFRFAPAVDFTNYALIVFNLLVVKATVKDPQVVAAYAACFVLAQANLPIFRSVARGFFSQLAAASHAGDASRCSRLLTAVSRILLIGLCLETTLAIRIGAPLTEWFSGLAVRDSGLPAALLLGTGLFAAANVFSELLASTGRLKLRFLTTGVYGVAGIALNLILPGKYGMSGSVAAFILSGALALGMIVLASQQIAGKWRGLPTTARCLTSGLVALLVSMLLPSFGGLTEIAVIGFTTTAVFFTVLLVLGEFSIGELRAPFRFVSRRRRAGPTPEVPH